MSHRRAKRIRAILRSRIGDRLEFSMRTPFIRQVYQSIKADDRIKRPSLPTLKELHRVRANLSDSGK